LWPPTNDCGGPSFSESAISDLESTMRSSWASCPEYGESNLDFWSHEWSKHGTCSGLDEHAFFSAALALRDSYASDCAGIDATSCELDCSGSSGPCSRRTAAKKA
jgi:ribonuclease T2